MNFEQLRGKTIVIIDKGKPFDNEIIFTLDNGEKYLMRDEDCAKKVFIDDICGDVNDIIGSEILLVEEVSSNPNYPKIQYSPETDDYESYLWTFYKLGTIKGYVDIKWLGSSNGNYSERVYFEEII